MSSPPPGRGRMALKERLKGLVAEYGALAIAVFIAISALVFLGMWTAVRFGWRPESAVGKVGTFGTAYVAYRLTLPLRVTAAVTLTPLVARLLERFGLRRPRQRT